MWILLQNILQCISLSLVLPIHLLVPIDYETNIHASGKKYYCSPDNDRYRFDAELVESIVSKLKRGNAAGLDSVTCKHLQYSHPLLTCVLAKVFNCMMKLGHVLSKFW